MMMRTSLLGFLFLSSCVFPLKTRAQIDPEKRRLLQFGYNQPLEGKGPIAGYGFYLFNEPNFWATNLTLRAAVAPIYLDTELGFHNLLGPSTDLAVGLAGGGFAKSYSEIRRGTFREEESFTGHGAEGSASIYHKFNPGQTIPLFGIVRTAFGRNFYERDAKTASNFKLPEDISSLTLRTGLRLGGQEPTMTAPLAMELSLWYEGQFRDQTQTYGFAGDRGVEQDAHLFWARGLILYTFDESRQRLELSVTAGTSIDADRFSAFRLGGVLPFASEFPLNIPGYYFQELSARRFALFNAQYSLPLDSKKRWLVTGFGATGAVDYLAGLEQPGHWHSGLGGGLTFRSPSGSWLATLVYAHGFDAIRSSSTGANAIGLLFQYDFEAKAKWINYGISPYRSRGLEQLFRR